MSNYPDDIRQYDHDSRSPFYDDGGHEKYTEERANYLIENPDEIYLLNNEELGEILLGHYKSDEYVANTTLHKAMYDYIEKMAIEQASDDFDNKIWENDMSGDE